ncbi:extracellular solute-binding protein [Bdellovibrio sp.]|uniref:extracellular solute-binding protein n=1 Tax=Bdellovibrio TaxID=958 RepID=UPI003221639C
MSSKLILNAILLWAGVFSASSSFAADVVVKEEIVVYSARKEELIKPIFDQFTKETGIAVKFLSDDAPKLIARLESEGAASPADLLITVDVANLTIAKDKGLFAPVKSKVLEKNVPAIYRDKDSQWFALSKRVRAIFYNKEKVKPEELSTYEDLANTRWKGEILTRSSAHPYNQSLLANIVAVHGAKEAQKWADGFVANLARKPQGGDSDQLKAVAAGEAKLAIANSYYYGRMMTSDLPEDKLVAQKVGIFFPNQKAGKGDLTGAHVNISGGGILKTSKNAKNAQKLLEFLSGDHAQNIYAAANKEFPVNPTVKADTVLAAWGPFKNEGTNLSVWATHSKDATRIADKAGWK